MFDHIGLFTKDYARSKLFYEAALAPLLIDSIDGGDTGTDRRRLTFRIRGQRASVFLDW
jgi:catechol 2,3-dioxygenase-like lactoylglutathione lyase family enzyme